MRAFFAVVLACVFATSDNAFPEGGRGGKVIALTDDSNESRALPRSPFEKLTSLEWDAPTHYTSGMELPPDAVLTYNLYENSVKVMSDITTTTVIRTNTTTGSFVITVTATLDGFESDPSVAITNNVLAPSLPPAAPTNVRIAGSP